MLLGASGGQVGGVSGVHVVSLQVSNAVGTAMCGYLTVQQASLETLPVLAMHCSEERATTCVNVSEGFIFGVGQDESRKLALWLSGRGISLELH